MTDTDRKALYKAADRLSHDALTKFLRDNDMDEDRYMLHRRRLMVAPTIRSVTRKVKAKILKEQGGCCNFCRDPIPHGGVPCYSKYHDDVLCRRCSNGLTNVRALVRTGITFEMIQKRIGGNEDV